MISASRPDRTKDPLRPDERRSARHRPLAAPVCCSKRARGQGSRHVGTVRDLISSLPAMSTQKIGRACRSSTSTRSAPIRARGCLAISWQGWSMSDAGWSSAAIDRRAVKSATLLRHSRIGSDLKPEICRGCLDGHAGLWPAVAGVGSVALPIRASSCRRRPSGRTGRLRPR